MKRLFLGILLLLVPACSATVQPEAPKVYDNVADCPPEWQAWASADGHTGVDYEPSEGVVHWVATCDQQNLDCEVKIGPEPCDGLTFEQVASQPACNLGFSQSCTFHFPHPEGPDSVTFTCVATCDGSGHCDGAHFESD